MKKKETSKSKTKNSKKSASGKKDFHVVGIGASAGGIKALQEFFATMPPNSGMAFVVILHLSPEHESNLTEIIQARTEMPVTLVTDTNPIEPDHVYVIPPNRQLEMVDDVVRCTAPAGERGSRVAVDVFFRTLADVYREYAVCVVLSGTGTDGTLGLKAIKEANGFAIVQAPEDAEYDSMPRSAIATHLADWILPVRDMPEKLIQFRESSEKLHLTADGDEREVAKEIQADESLREILTVLRVRTGHDFSNYKTPTLVRRMARHLQIHNLESISGYLNFLRENPLEIQSLLKNLLINVTNFFRDKEAWEVLQREVIPMIFDGKKSSDTIRVWACGCASGEEAYSLAIILSEFASLLQDPPKIQIFATDVDEDAIAEAREHRYPQSIEADVSPERLKRFFTKEGKYYRVKKEMREMVLFAPHNVLHAPPFSRLDMIVCRNLLIYLNRETQERVMEIFHFALASQGYLFLGSSESAEGISEIFSTVDKKHRIFMRRAKQISPAPPKMPIAGRWEIKIPKIGGKNRVRDFSLSNLHYKLLDQIAPPSVMVNHDFDIQYLSESAGSYLRFKGGEPSNNLLKLVNTDLLPDLRAALFSVQRDQKMVSYPNVRARIEGVVTTVNIIVRAVELENETSDYILVSFDENKIPLTPSEKNIEKKESPVPDNRGAMEAVVLQLESDLKHAKDNLRATIEQHEISIEELKASNEELQAINEDLRSTTEELETSKEELQSVNEELTTVNQELKEKIEETSRTNSDLQNLMAATEIATIFLDRNFRIKRFTPPAAKFFNITHADIGRPLEHFTHRLDYDELARDAESVLRRLVTIECEISDQNNRFYLTRFLPYRTLDDRIEGVVLNFLDITERKAAEEAMRQSEEKYRTLFETIDEGFCIIEVLFDKKSKPFDYRFLEANPAFIKQTGLENAIGKTVLELAPQHEKSCFEIFGKILLTGKAKRFEHQAEALNPPRFFDVYAFRVGAPEERRVAVILSDITERKRREANLAFLVETSADFAPLLCAKDIMERVGERLARYLNLSRCNFSVVDVESDFIECIYAWRRDESLPDVSGAHRISTFLSEKGRRHYAAGNVSVINDTRNNPLINPATLETFTELNLSSIVDVPYLKDGHWKFLLTAARSEVREWRADEIELIHELAERIYIRIERARAEDALRESEEKLSTFVRATSEIVYEMSADWRVMTFLEGKEFIASTENPREDWTEEYNPEDERERVWATIRRAVETKSIFELEHRVIRLDGSTGWTFSRAVPILDDAGEIVKWFGAASDITTRKRAEEKMRFQGLLLDTVEQSVIATDLDGMVTYWNRFAEKLFGWTAEEAVGRSIYELTTPESELAQAKEIMSRLRNGENWSGDFIVHRRGGAMFLAHVSNIPIADEQGNLIGIVGVSVDTTRRRQIEDALRKSEEHLNLILESTKDYAIITFDLDGHITRWNKGAEMIFGWTEKEAVGQTTHLIFMPEDRESKAPEKELAATLKNGSAEDERWHVRKDGTRFFASGAMQLLHNDKTEGFVKICRDQTERLKTETALRDREMLAQLVNTQEDERRRIARDIHDHLGQQLTVLRLRLESLKKMCDDEKICTEIDGLSELINRLDREVDFLAWELRPAALDDLGLRAALGNFVNEWSRFTGIKADFHANGLARTRLDFEVETNLYRIAQEALNNIHKHSKAKNVSVLLERRKNAVSLIIEDDGIGFNLSDKKNRSKGIGLMGMSERAKLSGGTFEIESAKGRGTTMFVRVPLKNTMD